MTHIGDLEGMGTLHAWESFGDNAPPDIQAVAKGLGGGSVIVPPSVHPWPELSYRVDMLLLAPF